LQECVVGMVTFEKFLPDRVVCVNETRRKKSCWYSLRLEQMG
jgi:hypothetical protein